MTPEQLQAEYDRIISEITRAATFGFITPELETISAENKDKNKYK